MRCISLWQPWAAAWLLTKPDHKRYETRSWYTSYRGPLLVHAAKKRDGEVADFLDDERLPEALAMHGIKIADLAFGAIIGRVDLVGCCQMSRMPEPTKLESLWGNWSPERYAWERGPDPILFETPIPYRGAQQLFEVSDSFLSNCSLVPRVQRV